MAVRRNQSRATHWSRTWALAVTPALQVITLALVLGSMEARTPKDAWRSGSSAFMSCVTPGEYLKWLAAQGYPLSPGEDVITGDRTADAVYGEQSSADGKE